MKDLEFIYNSIKQNQLTAFNYTKTKDEAVCFNVIGIPDSDYSILTISVMKDKKRTISLDFSSFAKFMFKLEKILTEIRLEHSINESPLLIPLKDEISNNWYRNLDCHRLFIMPTALTFPILEELTNKQFADSLKDCGIKELSFYVNTESHSLKIAKFSK